MAPQKPVGVIGVGLMGEVYARRLVAAGFAVIGYDVDQAKNERLAGFGAKAGSLAEIATTCEPIVLAVFNTDQVEDVVEHTLVFAAAGKIVLCTSTCDPDRIAALGARVGDRLRFLETPVSGTSEQVRQGDGVGLIGGDFAPEGRVRQTLKDTHLMLDQAHKAGQALPLLQIHADVLEACIRHGDSERDNSIVIEEIRRRTR